MGLDVQRVCVGVATTPAVDVENSHVRILGSLVLNLWDCGGCVRAQFFTHNMPVLCVSSRCVCELRRWLGSWLPCVRVDYNRQDAFYEHYFESQREHIFRNVELLIYVFDIQARDLEVRRSG